MCALAISNPTSEQSRSRASARGLPHYGSARLLFIDGEPALWRAVRLGLAGAAFDLQWARTAALGFVLVGRWHPDVVIMDLSLPDVDGVEACAWLRTWSQVPIVVLSARASDADKITAFEQGADDYLTKPFSMAELIARIRVALRHGGRPASASHDAGFESWGLQINFERRLVTVGRTEVHLTPTEYEVLKYLALNIGKVVTHRTLLRAVWGPACEDATQYLHVCIGRLRRKIEPEVARPRILVTEPGIGYRLRSTDRDSPV